MLAPAIAAIKAYVASNYSDWPLRWRNDRFSDGSLELPVDVDGNPSPAIEAEIIGGRNAIEAFSTPGNRLFIQPGLIRFYLSVAEGGGDSEVAAEADVLAAILERKEFGQSGGQTVRTGDFSVFDDVASYVEGNRFVLMASVPFEFYYTN